MRKNRTLAVIVLVAAGVFRFFYPAEYELKGDEVAMVHLVAAARETGHLPWLGMPSSQGFKNPGMSVWPFVGLSYMVGGDAFSLTQGVRLLNFLAFVLAILAVRRLSGPSQRIWLWGLLLAAVNPLEVILQRKLWAQSVLPIFAVGVWWLWRERKRTPWHAFGFGILASVIGQIHLSGVFVAAGFLAVALYDRKKGNNHWIAVAMGLLVAGWPMFFWIEHVLAFHSPGPPWFRNLVTLRFFHLLASNLSGTVMSYSLGQHFDRFVAMPLVFLAHIGLGISTLLVLGQGAWSYYRKKRSESKPDLPIPALVLSTGLVMTLAGVYVERHYYLGLFPLPFVWLTHLAFRLPRPERLLTMVVVMHVIVSASLLLFIHVNGGAPGADFGALPGRG